MDGLMFDTERLCTRASGQTGEELGYAGMSGFAEEVIGLRAAEGRKKYLERFGADFPYERFVRHRQEIIDKFIREKGVPLKPGLFELLRFLKREGLRTAVATSTSRLRALSYLKQSGVCLYLDRAVCGDMLEKCKPDPDIYLKAAAELEISPAGCMALEDSPRGICSAHAAGMTTVMIPDLIEPDDALKGKYDFLVPSLFDVVGLIEKEEGKRRTVENIG